MNITKSHSSKSERVLADLLVRSHIPFEFRKVIGGREVDFVIGRVIVEVDGIHHLQRRASEKRKNEMLTKLGYVPLHFTAKELRANAQEVLREIKKLVAANNNGRNS